MRPINKELFTINKTEYIPYGNAKDDLFSAIGQYCSYCERTGYSSALDVEHVKDKDSFSSLKFNWDNFILSCKNCNSIKGKKTVDNTLLPHIDDTFNVFIYLEGGYIDINRVNVIKGTDLETKTQNLINLVGLDRIPGHPKYSHKDKRWNDRKKVWELAKKYLISYEAGKINKEVIIDLAEGYGFWSIWMQIFKNHSVVKNELIEKFNGTRSEVIY